MIGRYSKRFTVAAMLVSFWVGVALDTRVAAHGPDHPPPLRNNRNQFTFLEPPTPAPMTPIVDEHGSLLDLGRFRGRVVLLNIWATWCPPCIRELPALDRLQSALADRDFKIVALSIDSGDIEVPTSFVRGLGLKTLSVYLDFTAAMVDTLPLIGLPTTYLISREVTMIGYIVGEVAWDEPAAIAFLTHYIE